MDTPENITTSTTQQDITVAVPEDRLPEFYAMYAHFLARTRGEGRRGRGGRRGGRGPGRHGHGPGHGHGPHGHGCHGRRDEEQRPAEAGETPGAQTV